MDRISGCPCAISQLQHDLRSIRITGGAKKDDGSAKILRHPR